MLQGRSETYPPIRLWSAGKQGLMWHYIRDGKVYRSELVCRLEWYSLVRNHSVSPNRRYLVLSLHAETLIADVVARRWMNLTKGRKFADGTYTIDVIAPIRWSPNSRYLLARSSHASSDLLLCSIDPPRRRVVRKTGVLATGWYPDSRWFYYNLEPKGHEWQQADYYTPPFYRVSVSGGQPVRLTASEVQRVLTDWDFLAFGLRAPANSGEIIGYSYTPDRRMRLGWIPQNCVLVEHRGGKTIKLPYPPTSGSTLWILDISRDKRFLLVQGNKWDYYLMDISRGEWKPAGNLSLWKSQMTSNIFFAEFVDSGYLI